MLAASRQTSTQSTCTARRHLSPCETPNDQSLILRRESPDCSAWKSLHGKTNKPRLILSEPCYLHCPLVRLLVAKSVLILSAAKLLLVMTMKLGLSRRRDLVERSPISLGQRWRWNSSNRRISYHERATTLGIQHPRSPTLASEA